MNKDIHSTSIWPLNNFCFALKAKAVKYYVNLTYSLYHPSNIMASKN